MVRTATAIEMLVGAYTGFTPLVMEPGDVGGKTHDHRKVRKHMDYRCSTSPGGIRVVDLYFLVGSMMTKMIE
jgi:hypothetical protein